jgi:hypothetical protein
MTDSPAGAPEFKGHRAAYRELLEALFYAVDRFENEGDGGRKGARIASVAAARFLAVRHEDPRLAGPFLAIAQSLDDLKRGLNPPLFSRQIEARERDRSSERKHVQMLAGAAMEVLIRRGRTSPDAGRRVARAIQKWPSFRAQEVTWTTVRNWRSQVRRDTDPRYGQFRELCEFLLSRPNPEGEVEELLRKPPGIPR